MHSARSIVGHSTFHRDRDVFQACGHNPPYPKSGPVAQVARSTCLSLGGDLAIISSAEENQFVFDLIKKQDTFTKLGAWIGSPFLSGSVVDVIA